MLWKIQWFTKLSDKFCDEISDKFSESSILVMNLIWFSAIFGYTDDDKCLKCNGASTYNVASSCKVANTDKVASSFKYL